MKKLDKVILIAKALADKPKTFTELLEATKMTRPTLTNYLKELEEKGLIISSLDRKDKRKVIYSLNPNELAIITIDEVIEAIKEELRAVDEELKPEEEKSLREVLIKNVRPFIIYSLKSGEHSKIKDVVSVIFETLNGLALLEQALEVYTTITGKQPDELIDYLKSSEKTEKTLEILEDVLVSYYKVEPDKLNRADTAITAYKNILLDAIRSFSPEFTQKWMRTKAFRKSPFSYIFLILELTKRSKRKVN